MRTITLKNTKITASNNLARLAGDANTYQIRDYIRTELDGKWNAQSRSWKVDPQKVAEACGAAAAKQCGKDLYLAAMFQASNEGERVDWGGVYESCGW